MTSKVCELLLVTGTDFVGPGHADMAGAEATDDEGLGCTRLEAKCFLMAGPLGLTDSQGSQVMLALSSELS